MVSALMSQLTQFFKLDWSGPRSNGTGESSAKDRTRDKAPLVVIVMARWRHIGLWQSRKGKVRTKRIISQIKLIMPDVVCLVTVSRGGHHRQRHVWREVQTDGSSFSRRARKSLCGSIKILEISTHMKMPGIGTDFFLMSLSFPFHNCHTWAHGGQLPKGSAASSCEKWACPNLAVRCPYCRHESGTEITESLLPFLNRKRDVP